MRHTLHREHGPVHLVEHVDQLLHRRRVRIDHIVAEDDREGLVADELARDEHRVPEAERFALADVGEVDQVRDLADFSELIALAARFEEAFELDRHVEMVFDRVLAASRHQDDVVDPGGDRLFDAVLNDRLVDERQHFFRLRFGRRKEARAQAGGGKNGFADVIRWRCHESNGSRGLGPGTNVELSAEVACSIRYSSATTSTSSGPDSETAGSIRTRRSKRSPRSKRRGAG